MLGPFGIVVTFVPHTPGEVSGDLVPEHKYVWNYPFDVRLPGAGLWIVDAPNSSYILARRDRVPLKPAREQLHRDADEGGMSPKDQAPQIAVWVDSPSHDGFDLPNLSGKMLKPAPKIAQSPVLVVWSIERPAIYCDRFEVIQEWST